MPNGTYGGVRGGRESPLLDLLFGAKVGKDSFLRLEFDPILTPEFANKLYRKQFVFERCWNYAFGSDQHLS